MDHHRQVDIDTDGFTHLLSFTRHGNGRHQDDQAEGRPADVERNHVRVNAKIVMADGANHAAHHANQQQQGADHVRAHDVKVEEADIQQAALIRHVELAVLGRNHRQDGRDHQVERHHRFVNLAPEGGAEAAIHPRVDVQRHHQVRQHVGEDQAGGRVNDIQVKQQVGQRRGQEDDARQAELEVQHGVEVAQALLPLQTAAKQRIIHAEDLRHTARPTGTLYDMQTQAFGREARRQRDRQEG
ncbi:Uncharacterised protein [Klebsiella pneumoniae]|nr:Uncharacterised protein [Klebsiella pneumoniae]